MYRRLTRTEHLKAIEGIASDVRQARATIISSGGFGADQGGSYECLFRLSGTPIALRVDSAIFIEAGETVRVVGAFNRNGVFEASAYCNRSSGVSGMSKLAWRQTLALALVAIVLLGLFFFMELLVGDLGPLFRVVQVIIVLAFALVGWIIFVQWSEIRIVEKLLNDA